MKTKTRGYLTVAALVVAAAVTQALLGHESSFASMAILLPFAGTVSLKDLREKAKAARSAWTEARKAKKDAAEVDGLKAESNRLQEYIDNADAEGKKDEDTLDIKAQTASEVTLDEVETVVGKAIKKALSDEIPAHLKGLVTEASIKSLIAIEFQKLAGDSKAIKTTELETIVANTMKAQMDLVRRDKKFTKDPGDNDDGRGTIEMPVSWTKGNLPLHGKQLLNTLLKKDMNEGIDAAMIRKGAILGDNMLASYKSHAVLLEQHRGTPGMKALTSTGSATGDELVPTDLSAQLQRRFFLASNLAAVMLSREIAMPTNPYTLPLSTTRPTFYLETTENTAATGSTPGTGQPTLTAIRLVGQTDFSYELDEDSLIPVLPMLQMLMAEGAADAWEDVLINGDVTGTHQDTDTQAIAKAAARGFSGFRKLALAVSALKTDLTSGGVSTNANMLAVRKLLKKYGGDPRNLVWLASPTSAITLQGVSEVATVEKFGTRATIITGEIAALQGIPIIQSERVREDVDATGVNAASGNTKSTVQCVNLTRFLTGSRRDVMVEVWKDIQSGKNCVVASLRRAFVPIEVPSASITSVAIGYNFAP